MTTDRWSPVSPVAETGFTAVTDGAAADFLERSEGWLLEREAEHNLYLSLAYETLEAAGEESAVVWVTALSAGRVVGCVVALPGFRALGTDLPPGAAPAVASALADASGTVPALMAPAGAAEALAGAMWGEGAFREHSRQRLYRLDEVIEPAAAPGGPRAATPADIDFLAEWGDAFGEELGEDFTLTRPRIERMVEGGHAYLWVDDGPVTLAIAAGQTPRSSRIGFVYTPPEARGRGYASSLVAWLSATILSEGRFCVLYTDAANPATNRLYRRLGYYEIGEIVDCRPLI